MSLGRPILASALAGGLAAAAMAQISIIPQPSTLKETGPGFAISASTRIVADADARPAATMLAEALKPSLGRSLRISSSGEGIVLRRDKSLTQLGTEGYRLTSSPKGIVITAPEPAGLFYGVQSLRQLLPPESMKSGGAKGVQWVAPGVEIEDVPRFRWRGAMLDVARHFQPKEYIKRFLDLMALHKLNTFHWHLTDDQGWRIEIKRYPRLTQIGGRRSQTLVGRQPGRVEDFKFDGEPHQGWYTQDEIREIVAYAAARNITVVPEIEMPGHAQAAIAAYPELGNVPGIKEPMTFWGVNDNIFNVNESTIVFLQNVLEEVLALFPSQFIHIGGDEVPKKQWKESPAAQARMKELGLKNEEELQSWFVGRMDTFLDSKGRRLVGWDEILEGGLAPGATVMNWRSPSHGIEAAKAGHDVVMANTSHTYFDYFQSRNTSVEPVAIGGYLPLRTVYSFNPIPAELPADKHKHVLGVQGQLWTEYIRDSRKLEYMAFPRLSALSEVGWSPAAARNYEGFVARLETHLKRLDALDVNYRPLGTPEGVVVGGWRPGEQDTAWRTRVWNITSALEGPGAYSATFQYLRGGIRLDVEWVEILVNGAVATRIDQYGITGNFNRDNVYRFRLDSIPAGAKVELRANVKGDGGSDSTGEITLAKTGR